MGEVMANTDTGFAGACSGRYNAQAQQQAQLVVQQGLLLHF